MSNLLLNAVALEFVLSVDELIFDALATHQLKHVLTLFSSAPLPTSSSVRRWRGLDFTSVATMLVCVAGMALMVSLILLPL